MPTYTDAARDARRMPPSRHLSWSAILAGVAIALAVELLLGLLGAGIGFSLLDPAGNGGPTAGGFGIGATAWWALSTIVALGAGGYGAVRAAAIVHPFEGLVHGLAIWAVTLLLTFYLLTSAIGGIVGGAFKAFGGIATAAGASVGAVAPTVAQAAGIDDGDVDTQVSALIAPTQSDPAAMTREESRKAILVEMPALARGGNEGNAAESRIADIVAAQDHVSREEALKRVEQARQRFLDAKHGALTSAKDATSAGAGAAAGTAFTAFLVLLLGAASAGISGSLASRRHQRAA